MQLLRAGGNAGVASGGGGAEAAAGEGVAAGPSTASLEAAADGVSRVHGVVLGLRGQGGTLVVDAADAALLGGGGEYVELPFDLADCAVRVHPGDAVSCAVAARRVTTLADAAAPGAGVVITPDGSRLVAVAVRPERPPYAALGTWVQATVTLPPRE